MWWNKQVMGVLWISMGSLCMECVFWVRIDLGQLPDTHPLHLLPSCGVEENGRMEL